MPLAAQQALDAVALGGVGVVTRLKRLQVALEGRHTRRAGTIRLHQLGPCRRQLGVDQRDLRSDQSARASGTADIGNVCASGNPYALLVLVRNDGEPPEFVLGRMDQLTTGRERRRLGAGPANHNPDACAVPLDRVARDANCVCIRPLRFTSSEPVVLESACDRAYAFPRGR